MIKIWKWALGFHRSTASPEAECACCGATHHQRDMVEHAPQGWFCSEQEWVTYWWRGSTPNAVGSTFADRMPAAGGGMEGFLAGLAGRGGDQMTEKKDKVRDRLRMKAASLLRLDRFLLKFADGTDVTLTLVQIEAIRLLPYATSGIRLSALAPAVLAPGLALLPLVAKALPVRA